MGTFILLVFYFLVKEKGKTTSQYLNLITNLKIFDNLQKDIKYFFFSYFFIGHTLLFLIN